MPIAPASRARSTAPGSASGTRTKGVSPAVSAALIRFSSRCGSTRVCSVSRMTKSYPAQPIISTIVGSGSVLNSP